MKFWASLIALVLISLGLLPCYAKQRSSSSMGSVWLTGYVRPRMQVEIMSEVAGTLQAVHVAVGDRVTKGQVIAQLETGVIEIQLAQAEADFDRARATLRKIQGTAETDADARYASAFAMVKKLELAQHQAEIDAKLRRVETEIAIKQAEAHLQQASAKLKLAESGARVQQVEQARARLESAKQHYERQVALQEEEFVSLEQVERAKLAYVLAQEELDLLLEGSQPEAIEIARTEVEIAQANLELNKANAMQLELTGDSLALVKAQLDEALANLRTVEIEKTTELWKTAIIIAEADAAKALAAVNLAKKRIADASIRSPIDGVVALCQFDPGAIIQPTVILFKVVDIAQVRIHTNLIEQDILKVKKGSTAEVTAHLYVDEVFKGKVIQLSPVIDGINQTAEIVVGVENPKGLLKPGMQVRIQIPVFSH